MCVYFVRLQRVTCQFEKFGHETWIQSHVSAADHQVHKSVSTEQHVQQAHNM